MKISNIVKRISAFVLAGVLAFPAFGMTTQAEGEDTGNKYVSEDTYVLSYGEEHKSPEYQYLSWYKPRAYKAQNTPGARTAGTFYLYNTIKEETVSVYCMDSWVSTVEGANYRRLNLEDATYLEGGAGLMRSIVLNGFPTKTPEEIGAAAKIDGLTVCESVLATQLAIWRTAYGEEFPILDFWHSSIKMDYWDANNIEFFDECNAEFKEGFPDIENSEKESAVEGRVKAVYDYLMSLEPTGPRNVAVSNASFTQWSVPQVQKNEDGTYNVTVIASVNVKKSAKDTLTLSAVMGDGTYYTSIELKDGVNNATLTIENVPANIAKSEVRLAIDGMQTVEDVFMFDAESDRTASQTLVGICGDQLPVHAEVVAEPERVINLYKSTKVPNGLNDDGSVAYTSCPLANITFNLYFVASLEKYVSGEVTLDEEVDITKLVEPVIIHGANCYLPDYVVTTDETGMASVSLTKNNLPDGVYVVEERANDAVKEPIKPFYIMVPCTNESGDGWVYEVTATPKNDVLPGPEVEKNVTEIDTDLDSFDIGETHTWILRGGVPVDIANGMSYVLTDVLDYRLDYKDNVKVTVCAANLPAGTETITLVKDRDYALSQDTMKDDDDNKIDTFVVKLTAVGMKRVADAVEANTVDANADEKLNNNDVEIRVYFDAVINENAVPGTDIPNEVTLDYKNSVGFEFTDKDDAKVYTCGINIKKYDAKETTKFLAGAEFMVARNATAAEIADQDIETKTLVTSAGQTKEVVYVAFYNNAELIGSKVTSVTTDQDGDAVIYGLKELLETDAEGNSVTGKYYLVETKAPNGYNLLSYPIEVTLNRVSHVNVDDPETEANEDMSVKVANSNAFELPSTGGIGTTIFTLTGALLTLSSGVVLVGKKKKEKE